VLILKHILTEGKVSDFGSELPTAIRQIQGIQSARVIFLADTASAGLIMTTLQLLYVPLSNINTHTTELKEVSLDITRLTDSILDPRCWFSCFALKDHSWVVGNVAALYHKRLKYDDVIAAYEWTLLASNLTLSLISRRKWIKSPKNVIECKEAFSVMYQQLENRSAQFTILLLFDIICIALDKGHDRQDWATCLDDLSSMTFQALLSKRLELFYFTSYLRSEVLAAFVVKLHSAIQWEDESSNDNSLFSEPDAYNALSALGCDLISVLLTREQAEKTAEHKSQLTSIVDKLRHNLAWITANSNVQLFLTRRFHACLSSIYLMEKHPRNWIFQRHKALLC
jgi:hypothetical protein